MNNELNQFDGDESPKGEGGNLTVKRNKTVDFIAKIGCVIIAMVIWFFAKGSDTAIYEDVFSSIPVKIVNTSDYSVLSGDGVTVDLTLSGKRKDLLGISKDDITAYVETVDISTPGKHKLTVKYDLPNGIMLVRSTSDSITVYFDNTSSVTVPVKTEVTNVMLNSGYELGVSDISTDIGMVTVTGPDAVVNRISHALLVADMNHHPLTGSVTYGGDVVLIDTDGNTVTNNYVKLSSTYVTANIPVYKYRDVPITVKYKYGYFNDQNCHAEIKPSFIRVRGEASEVDKIVLEYEIDEKKTSGNSKYTFKISLPEGVSNADGVNSAEISLSLDGITTKKVSVVDFTVNNPAELPNVVLTKTLDITLRGDKALLSKLTAADIKVSVDLSSQGGVSADVTVPVSIEFSEKYENRIYEVGAYSVSVRIGSLV